MNERKLNLKVLESHPCTQSWDEMRGTARERHCESCDRKVHNFAAMTARQIEELLHDHQRRLCARVVFRPDGSVRTSDGISQPSVAAGLFLAGSLMLPLSLAGQSASAGQDRPAHLSGRILKSDSSGPMSGAFVALLMNHQIVVSAHTDGNGTFEMAASPGIYDIAFGSSPSDVVRIVGYELRPGEQNLDTLPLMPQQTTTVTVVANTADSTLVGELSAVIGRPPFFWYFFRHPVGYMRSFRHTS